MIVVLTFELGAIYFEELSTPIMSLRKGIFSGHLQLDIMRKYPTAWRNFYEAVEKVRHSTIFAKDESKLLATNFPNRGPWFVKCIRGEMLRIGIIRK